MSISAAAELFAGHPDGHYFWYVALGLGMVVCLVVAALMVLLLSYVRDIDNSVAHLLDLAGQVAAQTVFIPQLKATAPVLELIVAEALIQDAYMNALTDGFGVNV
ncbi:MAG: hypothetical protein QOF77_15 [Solirubrobacteraceae bacterium]|jgi:hypothetical protein|nr:hypothetical protein [Solirubrobacteraceae bacterium]